MSLILRHYNNVIHTFNTDPASFEPIFWRGIQWGAAEWSEGFITGFMFNEDAWSLLSMGQPTWFTPFLRLGTDEGIDITKSAGDAETWMNGIEPALVRIHAYWKEKRGSPAGWNIQRRLSSSSWSEGNCTDRSWWPEDRPQRSLSLRQWQEVQKVLRRGWRSAIVTLKQEINMHQDRCEECGEITPGYDTVHYGSMDSGYRQLCTRCFNAAVAELHGSGRF
jgi:hypothetical protein